MQQTLSNKLAVLAIMIAVAFGLTMTAYASYDDLEIEIDVYTDRIEVEVEYEDEEKEYVYEDMTLDDVYKELVADVKEDFNLELTEEEIEDIADIESEDKNEEEEEGDEYEEGDKDDDKKSEFCDQTKQAAGWGVAKKCADTEDYVINDKLAEKVERFAEREDRFKDFGKTTDRAELQSQLRQLLLVLIELLEQQKALQEAGA